MTNNVNYFNPGTVLAGNAAGYRDDVTIGETTFKTKDNRESLQE